MDYIWWMGIAAGICTTVSFLPQVMKVHRTRHTRDLSLPMYLIFSLGVLLWTFYGFMVGSLPIVLANSMTLVFCGYILTMKSKYK